MFIEIGIITVLTTPSGLSCCCKNYQLFLFLSRNGLKSALLHSHKLVLVMLEAQSDAGVVPGLWCSSSGDIDC